MKILVCVSKTPDTTAKISFSADQKEFISDGVQFIMNPYDEWYTLVKALEIKEQMGGHVSLINIGDVSNDVIIRKGLAIGADEAIRINAEAKSSFFVAKQIADYAKDKAYDLVMLGKETIDYNGAEVGAMVAEFLGLPFIGFATTLEIADGKAKLTRIIEGGVELVSTTLPAVISASKGMAEQRIPNMRGIMMAKRKPLNIVEPSAVEDPTLVVKYELPKEKSGVKMIDPENMDELVRLLHEEAKVI